MFRISEVAKIIEGRNIKSVLDIGCRDCVLKTHLNNDIDYYGNDLFQNDKGIVNYVGDINQLKIDRTFDCVTAIDILEHTDDPYQIFDGIVKLADKVLIINLPNCYDLKSVYKFSVKGSLGGKYNFGVENSLDRHRWMMNYDQIVRFYNHKAREHNLNVSIVPIKYGGERFSLTSVVGNLSRYLLSKRLSTESVIGVFEKK
ncbi:methionine biosynthesis protein MetW [Mucilaginibacter polytrichastri]|uniref:Methyltransferase type 11 domain-containing protein n=1 Tax=Mucilaginibacter polytrichastri TaxID=1302689 RepID=A0A1Q6A380_9SPHI|nr:methionine biosynthesis protein MetW [Mucilaginibacter polytrichastri]OKS88466.1 hypothetical protein RG47T_3933 [Mucilaginibacter polytrichastri]SFT12329.1 Methionine biosynthesis protein MetW [Mucilaginibacter polytrichastri]